MGFPGNQTTQTLGITSVTLHPAIATLFALEAQAKHGAIGVVHIFKQTDLQTIRIAGHNVLASIEREIGLEILPLALTTFAFATTLADIAKNILSQFIPPILMPSRPHMSEITSTAASIRDMTAHEINLFVSLAQGNPP